MLTALISLYATATLLGNSSSTVPSHTMPWNDSALLQATSIPQKKFENIAPVIKAKSAIAVDLENGLILYEKNIHEPLAIASLTKLMTVVVSIEENHLKDVVTVSKNAASSPGSKIWLAPGEKITVESLMYAALIHSANDAAVALAEYNADSSENFVVKMNQKTRELGLISTHFINPTGLDEDESMEGGDMQNDPKKEESTDNKSSSDDKNPTDASDKQLSLPRSNYSTAYDLTLLGRYAFGKSFIRRAVGKKELDVASTNEKLVHKLKTTNELLNSYLKVLGLKTGTTDEAGECLIAIIENDDGHDILTVVLNSPSRYTETKVLADWVFRSYTWN